MKNYLPFANRILMQVPATGTLVASFANQPVQFGSMDIGTQLGGRAILGDLAVHAVIEETGKVSPGQIHIKYGWLERGFLTSKHIPLDVLMDDGFPPYRTWQFPRPYTLFSKEYLRFSARFPSRGGLGVCGATFNGRKVSTDEPWILHDGNIDPNVTQNFWRFQGRMLRAPADSDIEISSVSFANNDVDRTTGTGVAYQVIGPGNREWFKVDSQVANAGAVTNENELRSLYWVSPWSSLIKLGEEDGWYMHHGQTFVVDIRSFASGDVNLVLTLRGSLEVEDDRR